MRKTARGRKALRCVCVLWWGVWLSAAARPPVAFRGFSAGLLYPPQSAETQEAGRIFTADQRRVPEHSFQEPTLVFTTLLARDFRPLVVVACCWCFFFNLLSASTGLNVFRFVTLQVERMENMEATVGTSDHSDTSNIFLWNAPGQD